MSEVYVFEARISRFSRGRYIIYPPKRYQDLLARHHGRRVKVIVVVEPSQGDAR